MPQVIQNDEDTDSDQLKMDTPLASKSNHRASIMSSISEEDEHLELHDRKWERKAKLWRATVGLCACLLVSWLFGYLGFSSVWVLLMAIGAYRVWDGQVVDLVQENIRYEALRFRRKKAHRGKETAEWLNTIVNKWWVFASESIFTKIKENLDPLLKDSKPAKLQSVELCEFSLGQQTPYISQVRVFDVPLDPESTSPTKNDHQGLVVEAAVQLHCDDFHMLLRSRIGMGLDMDLAIEKLHISGTMQLSMRLRRDAQFPHVNKLSVTFVKKPEVWFSIRILNALPIMDVPGLKTWVHNLVMDTLTAALVDPEEVVLYTNVNASSQTIPSPNSQSNAPAQGILTVDLSWADPNECGQSTAGKVESNKWFLLRLGKQEHIINPNISSREWRRSHTFLVDAPQDETLVVKVKTKWLGSNPTLANYEVQLNEVLRKQKPMETVLSKKNMNSNSVPSILLKLQYKPLDPIILGSPSLVRSQPDGAGDSEPFPRAGVLYVCVHSADGLLTADGRETPNPFCSVHNNGKTVKTTHFASDTCNPKWESAVEFLVMDYSKTVISFTVWSRDSSKMTESSFLGLASLTLKVDEMPIVKREIPISLTPLPALNELNSGVITVSAWFREAPSLVQSDWKETQAQQMDIPVLMNHVIESSLISTAMMLSSVGSVPDGSVANGQAEMIELSLVRAKDLVSKDLNGYIDTYCEVKLGDECKFKTQSQRKTPNPQWDQNVILQMPNSSEKIDLIVWGHDSFGEDILGTVAIGADDIQRIADKDSGEWLKLNNTTSGELEVNFRILSEDKENKINIPDEPPIETAVVHATQDPPSYSPVQQPAEDTTPEPTPPTFQTFRPMANSPSPKPSGRDREPETASPKLPTVRRPSASSPRPPASHPPPPPPVVPISDATVDEKSPSPSKASSSTVSSVSSPSSDSAKAPAAVTPTSSTPTSGTHAYSSLRKMKNKVKKAFGQPLRRFRSEASVHEEKAKGLRERIQIERRKDDAYSSCTDIDSIPQDILDGTAARAETEDCAVSKPENIFNFSIAPEVEMKKKYYNVCGRVIQATALDVKGANTLYCRIKFISENCDQNSPKYKSNNGGRTIAKSKLLPANKNVPFNVDFKMDNSSGISGLAKLSFDIRTAAKEPFASKQVTIQELLEDVCVSKPGEQVCTCLSLDSGATLELVISFSKCTSEPVSQGQPNSVSKLLRSWSVHKIGKI